MSFLEYRITCGIKILLLPGFNPCTKDPHLSIIGLGSVQQIDNIIAKYIHLATLKIIVTSKLSGRAKFLLLTPGLFLHDDAIHQRLLLTFDSTSVSPFPGIDSINYLPVPPSTKNFWRHNTCKVYEQLRGTHCTGLVPIMWKCTWNLSNETHVWRVEFFQVEGKVTVLFTEGVKKIGPCLYSCLANQRWIKKQLG